MFYFLQTIVKAINMAISDTLFVNEQPTQTSSQMYGIFIVFNNQTNSYFLLTSVFFTDVATCVVKAVIIDF